MTRSYEEQKDQAWLDLFMAVYRRDIDQARKSVYWLLKLERLSTIDQ